MHPELRIVEVDHVVQRLRRSVVEIRRARPETTQVRNFELGEVGEFPGNQSASWVGDGDERASVAPRGYAVEGKILNVARERILGAVVRPAQKWIAGPGIEEPLDRVTAHLRRVVAGGAGTLSQRQSRNGRAFVRGEEHRLGVEDVLAVAQIGTVLVDLLRDLDV